MAIQIYEGAIGGYIGPECETCKKQVTPIDDSSLESMKKLYGANNVSLHVCQVAKESHA